MRPVIAVVVILMGLVLLAAQVGLAQSNPCKHIANYQMDVRLDVENKAVIGHEVLTWLNDSNQPVHELYFHLYLNAFKNNKSSFIQEALSIRGRPMGEFKKQIDWGYTDVQSMRILPNAFFEATDLTQSMSYVQPDDSNSFDQTVLKVPLPRPIPPQGQIKLAIDFYSKLPKSAPRTGYRGDYYFVAQWFPKIGVFWEGQWNCHQFHRNTEFFADYGVYDVNITVPRGYVVGATGEIKKQTENEDGTVTHNFYQEDVHDFVWTACPHYIEKWDTFRSPPLREVKMRLLVQPQHQRQIERYFAATRYALKYYGEWYGEYPYPHITIVDPAWGSSSGGMEYPTLFTGGCYWLTPKQVWSPESVTIHECGHQFWYGLVGNNEFEDAWLDEGFNSYSDSRVLRQAYGPNTYSRSFFGVPVAFDEVKIPSETRRRPRYLRTLKYDVMARDSWDYLTGDSYGAGAYDKPALMLWTLENYLGSELFAKIIKTYSLRWRFKHPRPKDFSNVVQEMSGQDMSWFFEQLVYGSDVIDYAVGDITSEPIRKKQGMFDENDGKKYYSGKEKSQEETIYGSDVIIRRLGEVKFPVEILVAFENGDTLRKNWDGQYRWIQYHFETQSPVKCVQVDPERKIVLDVNFTNNSRFLKPKRTAILKWTSRWMFWLQHLLEMVSFFS